jgi:hypothetical protein
MDKLPPPFPPSAVNEATSRVRLVFKFTVEDNTPDATLHVGASITSDEDVAWVISYKKVPLVADLLKKLEQDPVAPPPEDGTVIV